jgi:hypothetical protein
VVARPVVGSLSTDERHAVRWLALGSLLSVIPALSAFPASRLAVIPGFGAAAVLATVWRYRRQTRQLEPRPPRPVRIASRMLVILALAAPLSWGVRYAVVGWIGATAERLALAADLGGPEVDTVVFVNPPEPSVALYLPAIRWVREGEPPKRYSLLSFRPQLAWSATDAAVVLASGGDGVLLDQEFERLFMGRSPLVVGEERRRGPWRAVVETADALGPTRIRLALDRAPHDPSIRWLAWDGAALRAVRPGEQIPGFLEGLPGESAVR